MKLYGYWRSSTSYRLRIALGLKGLAYENCPVNLLENAQQDAAYVVRNPFAGVPMLEAEGRDRAQSMAVMEWLDERFPSTPLLPTEIEQRFTTRELSYAIATELHAPLNLKALKYLKNELGHDQHEVDTWYRWFLGTTLHPLEQRLEQIGTADYLFDAPGFFEAVLIPQIRNARRFEFDLANCPRMVRIEAACLAHPAFEKALPENQPDAH